MSEAPATQGWIRRLVGYMAPHKKNAYIAFGVAIGGQLIQSLLPIVQKVVIDDVITPHTSSSGQPIPGKPLAPWLTLMIVMGIATFVFAYFRRFRGGRIALDVQHDLRTAIFRQLQRLDFARHDELATGQLVSRASSDVALIQGFLQFMPIGVANILLFIVSFAAMIWLSPLLSLVMFAVFPALLFTAMKLRTSVFPASWDAQQKAGDVANVVEEDVTGVRVVKGFGQESRELDRLTERSRSMFGSRVRLVNITARLQPTMQTIPAFGQVAVLGLGGWLVLENRITLGTFLAFSTYMLLITPPIRQLAAILTVGQLARAGAERIYDLLDSTPLVQDKPDAVDLQVPSGAVRFEHVTFGYTSTEPVLKDFDLTVAAGETVALVGSSGSGKSTVALMLPRFYDVHAGRITIDGTDVRDVHLDSLRRSIGVVFEDSFLFSDSITANIGFGRPDATQEEIETAARAAEAHEFILHLPDGYATVVGEQGLTLSGGQRQRVALARALLSDPKILLLDDATSSIDSRVEEEIHATLRRIASTRTTILVAHRKSSLSLADRIVVVDHGAILDAGTHEELWERCNLYRLLLSGPGGDAEGLEVAVEHDDGQVNGITPSAWRGLDDEDIRSAQIAERTRTASPSAAVRVAGGGGGMGGGGGAGGWGGALAPTPELLAKVDALGPATADPQIDVEFESRPSPNFRFLKFLHRYRGWLAIGLLLVASDAVCTLAGPLLVRYGISGTNGQIVAQTLWTATAAFFVITLVDWWLMWAETRVMGRISERMLHALRIKIFAHLQRLGVDFYEHEMAGRIMTRMTTDIDALSQLLQNGLVNALVNLVTFVGVGIGLVFVDPKLALVTASILPPLFIGTIWFRSASSRAYETARERIAAVNANLQEGLSGVRVSQAFVREDKNQEVFTEIASGYRDARVHAQRLVAIYFPFVDFLSDIAVCVVLGAGSVLVANGSLTVPDLIAFLLFLNLFFAPIQQLSQVFDSYQQARVAIDRISELLATPTTVPAPVDPVIPDRLRGDVELTDVHFKYSSAVDEALRGVDLHIGAGETVALVGETGAGKSTVMKLVARFYDPTSGSVSVDGVDVERYDPVAFHQQLGVVPQEAFLFSGTIRDNIAYGREAADDAEVEAAAREVGAHEFIASLPGGYLQWVSERGRSLSSGQRQLIALARAHLVDPAILLLDEATSNLDLQTEAKVQAAMGVAATGRTTILIAHRLQTARLADRIVVVDDGRVVEQGSHDELLVLDAQYARMWASAEGETVRDRVASAAMPDMPRDETGRVWWRDGVLYQIYPRSYMDTNADGIGDLRGVIERLDHLQWLGVEGIWLDPITVSPDADWGYDVADYCDVNPPLGTLADADALVEEAAKRGIRVLLDLVPNHTSDRHPWFVDARSSRTSRYRDWYVWADPKPDGSVPNNWVNNFNPAWPAWTFDEATEQYYLNHFLPSQPDLNWWNEDVRDEFDRILRFWFDRGVAGFRIDVCHMIVKDRLLRDNPPATADDHWYVRMTGQRQVYNASRPEVHDVLRRWRAIADSYDPHRILVGETYVLEPELFAAFYGDGDELNLAFNFMLLHAELAAGQLRRAVEESERLLPPDCWPVWTGGNHDNHRFPTRWAAGDPDKARTALFMLLTLRGTPFLYYGDELGMADTDITADRMLDPVGHIHGHRIGRDPERTPMPWTAEPGAGFTTAGVEPWLPFGDLAACNVASQRHDPVAMLALTRDLVSLRDAIPDLARGDYRTDPRSNSERWIFRRGERVFVALNMADEETKIASVHGLIRISTDRSRDAMRVDGDLLLAPWESVVIWLDQELA